MRCPDPRCSARAKRSGQRLRRNRADGRRPHRRLPRFFFFNDRAATDIYPLSLHDALPISYAHCDEPLVKKGDQVYRGKVIAKVGATGNASEPRLTLRSEEHTSALQSHLNLVCRLLLETKTTTPNALP